MRRPIPLHVVVPVITAVLAATFLHAEKPDAPQPQVEVYARLMEVVDASAVSNINGGLAVIDEKEKIASGAIRPLAVVSIILHSGHDGSTSIERQIPIQRGSNAYKYTDVSSSLSVTPTVADDGWTISLRVHAQFRLSRPQPQPKPPIYETYNVNTRLSVKSGESAVIWLNDCSAITDTGEREARNALRYISLSPILLPQGTKK